MATLYPLIPGCNDQNALAIHFFNVGFGVWRLVDAAIDKIKLPATQPDVDALRKSLQMIKRLSKEDTPARIFASAVERAVDKCCTTGHAAGRLLLGDAKMICSTGRTAATVREAHEEDQSRRWFLIGIFTAGCDLQPHRERTRDPLRAVDNDFLKIIVPVVGDRVASRLIMQATGSNSLLHDTVIGYLNANAQALWQPPDQHGTTCRFNGRELSNVEYEIMELVFHAGQIGLTTKQLTATHPSGANVLGRLRKYPETKPYLSLRSPARFISPAPPPPSSSSH